MTRKLQAPMGLYYEEFEVGDQVESVGRTITEADIVSFASLSGDWNLIHTNADYCKEQHFGQRIAHGLLVLSVASGLAVRLGFMEETVVAFMGLEWQFRRPVFIGDTMRIRVTIASKEIKRRLGGVVVFRVEVLNQKDEVCQRGDWNILCKMKEGNE